MDDVSTNLLTNWKIVFPLLKTIHEETLIQAICDAIIETIFVSDLPDICHSLYFGDYLYNVDPFTQKSSGQLLERICIKFSIELTAILQNSGSDGDFLTFREFDIENALRENEGSVLLKSQRWSGTKTMIALDEKIVYQKAWYEKQKFRLRKFISATAPTVESKWSMKYDEIDLNFVGEKDLTVNVDVGNNVQGGISFLSEKNIPLTSESWFVRLFRFSIVNLLHDDWQVRLCSAKSILAIIKGLSISTVVSSSFQKFPSPY